MNRAALVAPKVINPHSPNRFPRGSSESGAYCYIARGPRHAGLPWPGILQQKRHTRNRAVAVRPVEALLAERLLEALVRSLCRSHAQAQIFHLCIVIDTVF